MNKKETVFDPSPIPFDITQQREMECALPILKRPLASSTSSTQRSQCQQKKKQDVQEGKDSMNTEVQCNSKHTEQEQEQFDEKAKASSTNEHEQNAKQKEPPQRQQHDQQQEQRGWQDISNEKDEQWQESQQEGHKSQEPKHQELVQSGIESKMVKQESVLLSPLLSKAQDDPPEDPSSDPAGPLEAPVRSSAPSTSQTSTASPRAAVDTLATQSSSCLENSSPSRSQSALPKMDVDAFFASSSRAQSKKNTSIASRLQVQDREQDGHSSQQHILYANQTGRDSPTSTITSSSSSPNGSSLSVFATDKILPRPVGTSPILPYIGPGIRPPFSQQQHLKGSSAYTDGPHRHITPYAKAVIACPSVSGANEKGGSAVSAVGITSTTMEPHDHANSGGMHANVTASGSGIQYLSLGNHQLECGQGGSVPISENITQSSLIGHKAVVRRGNHGIRKRKSEARPYECPYCPLKFKRKHHLNRHVGNLHFGVSSAQSHCVSKAVVLVVVPCAY